MGGREGAHRPILCVNEPQKMGERGQNKPVVYKITTILIDMVHCCVYDFEYGYFLLTFCALRSTKKHKCH